MDMSHFYNARKSQGEVTVPHYDRSILRRTWVHLGPSHFFRAHQAFYVHKLNEVFYAKGMKGIGVTAVSLRSKDVVEKLQAQGGLYTLVEQGPKGEEFHVVGSVVSALHAPTQSGATFGELTSPDTTIVTLTVTQKGYHLSPSDGKRIDTNDPSVKHDMDHPNTPKTAPGFIVEALYRRYKAGNKPFTTLSCDNMPGNGHTLRAVVLDLARLQCRDLPFLRWLTTRCTFPDSMVDRIAPQCTPSLIETVHAHGINDAVPVPTEAGWTQWVVQDSFCNVRPPLELVGVEIVKDTSCAELTKLRMLNGAHMALGLVASQAGFKHVHEAMANPLVRRFLRGFHAEMAASLAEHCPEIDFRSYTTRLHERLANPAIKDEHLRLTRDVSKKLNARLLSAVRDVFEISGNQDNTTQVKHLMFVAAAWMHFVRGECGAVVDPRAEELKEMGDKKDPSVFLVEEWIGEDLSENTNFTEGIAPAYRLIGEVGMRGALAVYSNKPTHVTTPARSSVFNTPRALHIAKNASLSASHDVLPRSGVLFVGRLARNPMSLFDPKMATGPYKGPRASVDDAVQYTSTGAV